MIITIAGRREFAFVWRNVLFTHSFLLMLQRVRGIGVAYPSTGAPPRSWGTAWLN